MRSSIDLLYDLGDRQLNLTIAPGTIQFPEPLANPAVVFSATFSYNIAANAGDRLAKIAAIIANWQQELTAFDRFIRDRFELEPSDRLVVHQIWIEGFMRSWNRPQWKLSEITLPLNPSLTEH